MAYLGIDPKVAYSSYRNIDDISASFDGFVDDKRTELGVQVSSVHVKAPQR